MLFDFTFGICNTWLLTVPMYASGFLVAAWIDQKSVARLFDVSWYKEQEKRDSFITMAVYYLGLVVSVGIPLRPDTLFFFPGILLFGTGVLMMLLAFRDYARTDTTAPATQGIYRISRNPQYTGGSIAFLGAACTGGSPLLAMIVLLYSLGQHRVILAEERFCQDKYGTSWNAYAEQTARYLGRPGEKPS